MIRWYISGCAVGFLLLSAGCSKAPKTAPDTRATDEKAIRDGEAAWSNDWSARDIEKLMSHYADDATLMAPDAPTMSGKEAIRNGIKGMLADKSLSLTFATASAEVSKSGDLAYTQGSFTLTETNPKTKQPVTETGKYVTIYKKQSDGSWKAIEDIASRDAPATPTAAAEPGKQARRQKQKHLAHRH